MSVTKKLLLLNCLLAGLCTPVFVVGQSENGIDYYAWYKNYSSAKFVITLPVDEAAKPNIISRLKRLNHHVIYTAKNRIENANRPSIHIGFFNEKSEAETISGILSRKHSQVIIRKITEKEHARILAQLKNPKSGTTETNYFIINDQASDEQLLERAKMLFAEKKYTLARRYYSILSYSLRENTASWANELIGLTYERDGKRDKAIQTYQDLLEIYPESTGAKRVSQRLIALQTAPDAPNTARRKAQKRAKKQKLQIFGYLSQFYRTLYRKDNDEEEEQILESISTNADIQANYSSDHHKVKAQVGGYAISDQIRDDKSFTRLRRAYVDYTHRGSDFNIVLGRQRNSLSGTFQHFDGVHANYPVLKNMTLGATYGKPVFRSEAYDDLNIEFFSINSQLRLGNKNKINLYALNQTLEAITDRQAVGFNVQHAGEKLYSSFNFDYDINFKEINFATLNANYRFNYNSNISTTFGYQKTPFLSTSNVIVADPEQDINFYLSTKDNQELLAEQVTELSGTNQYASLAYAFRLDKNIQLITDLYSSILTNNRLTDDNGAATEFQYNAIGAQLVASDFLPLDDSTTLGFRISSSTGNEAKQFFISEKIRFGKKFYVQPRFSFITSTRDESEVVQNQLRYSLTLSYKPLKKGEFNFEAGNQRVTLDDDSQKTDSFFFYGGYRLRF